MSEIATIVGQRLRLRRQELGYSQELTSEKAGLHPTYIGQVERGEKNATIESIEKYALPWICPWRTCLIRLYRLHQNTKSLNSATTLSLVSLQKTKGVYIYFWNIL